MVFVYVYIKFIIIFDQKDKKGGKAINKTPICVRVGLPTGRSGKKVSSDL